MQSCNECTTSQNCIRGCIRDVTVSDNERLVFEGTGISIGDYTAPTGGRVATGPNRLAQYQQNWSGMPYWQTWDVLEYPKEYRAYLKNDNVTQGALLMIARNPATRSAAAPIAIGQYALQTQQVYAGQGDTVNGY